MRRTLATLGALAVVLVAANVALARTHLVWDLSAGRSNTLSAETLRVLGRVREPVRMTALFAREQPGRVEAATLLSRYRAANHRIAFEIADPALRPGAAPGGADPGNVVVAGYGRVEVAPFAIEIDITSALARLLRGSPGTVCFTSGHGERDPSDRGPAGYSSAAKLLADNAYRVRSADLLATPRVPEGCEAIVVAAPAEPLGEPARDAVLAYLRSGGKAAVLADPSSGVDPSELTREWGIGFVRGLVVATDPADHLPGDPLSPIVRRYTAVPAVRGLGPTFFPGVEQVTVEQGGGGLTVAVAARTGDGAYLERDPSGGAVAFDPTTDVAGPIAVGAAADDSSVEGAVIRRTRVLAWGDADFASNRFVSDASNARLFVQAVDWLTQSEPLIAAVPSFPAVRELRLTQQRSTYMLVLTAGIVPLLYLFAGALVWAVRRGR